MTMRMVDDDNTEVHQKAALPAPRRRSPAASPAPRSTRAASPLSPREGLVAASPLPPREAAPAPVTPPAGTPVPPVDEAGKLLSLVRRIALQSDLASSLRVLGNDLAQMAGCIRVHCLTADPLTGAPWSESSGPDSMAGLTAHHRQAICAQPAAACPVYVADVDNPGGNGREKILTHPIAAGDVVIAVLIAVRGENDPPFTPREGALLGAVGAQVAPLLLTAVQAATARSGRNEPANPLFRQEALARHRVRRREGAVLDLSPRWIDRVYPSILLIIAGALLYGIFGRINQYSTGPALIRIEGTEITARSGGTVVTTYVEAGQEVTAGQLLVQLHDDSESAELGETLLEYERQLATFLFDPSNEQAKSSLSSIAARRQRAKQVLETRSIRAPRDGLVSDLRVREGSRLEAGAYIMTVVSADAMPTLIALLPGHDRPRLKPGMRLQFKIPGYEKTNDKAVIDEVGEEVIGPQEARRYVGDKIADALAITGPVVIVRAKLPSRTFESRDQVFDFHDGMTAVAEASVRKRSVLVALIPALEKLF